MARPIWTGVISFGLVSVPVAMFSATEEHEVSFHQFQKGTADRIRYKRVNERTGKEVDFDDIVKGADVGGGQYVMLDPDELDQIAPGRSRALDIHRFVDLDEVDPIYYQKTYYLAPGSDETVKTYALLRDAMTDANRAAIATLVMRGKEYLAAIRPDGDLLVLETMFFADEVRDPHQELDRLPGDVSLTAQERAMAGQLIDSMTGGWNPADYHDSYTDRVHQLIDAKVKGNEITPAEEAPAATNVTDLMEVLRRSVEAARSNRGDTGTAADRKPRREDDKPRRTAPAKSRKQADTSGSGRRRSRSAAGADLADMTKTELAKLAGRLDIAGRSSMNRAELEKAVAAARKPRRRAS